jgi:tetratricopeptide (TPR) repeat protein
MRSHRPLYEALRAAQARHAAGDLSGALVLCEQVIAQAPTLPTACMMFGLLLMEAGRHEEACSHLRLGLAHHPGDSGLRETLANCLIEMGSAREAVTLFRQILEHEPGHSNARFNLGRALINLRDYAEAERVYVRFCADHPRDAEGFNHLGLSKMGLGDAVSAEPFFRASIRLVATDPLFHSNLAQALAHQGRHGEAESVYLEAARLDPESPRIRNQLGWFCITRGNLDAAQEYFEAARARSPGDVNALAGLAMVLERRGELTAARVVLMPHIEAMPPHPKIAICFARVSKQLGQPEAALPVVRRALKPAIPKQQEAGLRFVEGDVLDAMGEVDAAFEAYSLANEAQGVNYDRKAHEDLVDRLIQTFTPQFLACAAKAHQPSKRSALVIGMPRSGTSLIEQILSTHPDIHGAGELDDFPTMAQQLPSIVQGGGRYPECLRRVDQVLMNQLVKARTESLSRASSAPLVIDKMPMNFLHLGLISLVSPGARVIHCVRDPIDTSLSCFFQHFGGQHYAFSTQLESLVSYYRQYERLMKHWEEVLPVEIMTVRYEEVVADVEQASRQMLAFLGIAWAPEVLRFHENQRTVRTASYAQVRRPIYSTSIGRGERYAHHLGPLMALHTPRR